MKKWILLAIIFLAIFFRFYQIAIVPSHPSLDEVSIGYNAYSILKTGSDEFGTKFPILLRAYDDWRPALYVYFVIPFVQFFGLSVFAVRFPSVILSVISVIATFFLVREFFFGKLKVADTDKIALIATSLLAISPWHIYISRLGHEANAGFCFFILGMLFFLRFVNFATVKQKSFGKNVSLIFSSIFFALSFDAYQSEKIIVPIILVFLFFVYRNELLLKKKIFMFSCFLGFLIILPVFIQGFSPNAFIRFKQTSIFTPAPDLETVRSKNLLESLGKNDYQGILLNNQKLFYTRLFASGYLSHLGLSWIFMGKSNEGFKIPGFGLLYLFELPLLLGGAWFVFRSKDISKRIKSVLIAWLLISILPGALTTQPPHAMRIFTLLPFPQILEAFCIYSIYRYFRAKNALIGLGECTILLFVIAIFVFEFFKAYFFEFPKKNANQFQYGIQEALTSAQKKQEKYDKIVVSNRGYLSQSYMFYLFTEKYDPALYQRGGGSRSGRFEEKHAIGKYIFTNDIAKEKVEGKKVLYLYTESENISNVKIIKDIILPTGQKAITLSEKI